MFFIFLVICSKSYSSVFEWNSCTQVVVFQHLCFVLLSTRKYTVYMFMLPFNKLNMGKTLQFSFLLVSNCCFFDC